MSGVPSGVRNPRCSAHSLRRRMSTTLFGGVLVSKKTPLTSMARCSSRWNKPFRMSLGKDESSDSPSRLAEPTVAQVLSMIADLRVDVNRKEPRTRVLRLGIRFARVGRLHRHTFTD